MGDAVPDVAQESERTMQVIGEGWAVVDTLGKPRFRPFEMGRLYIYETNKEAQWSKLLVTDLIVHVEVSINEIDAARLKKAQEAL